MSPIERRRSHPSQPNAGRVRNDQGDLVDPFAGRLAAAAEFPLPEARSR